MFDDPAPFLWVAFGTMLVGGLLLALAWIQVAVDRVKPGRALYAFTASVLLDTAISIYHAPADYWAIRHRGLWFFITTLVVVVSFVLMSVTLFLTRQSRGIVKISSRVLVVMNLLGFALLIYGICADKYQYLRP